MNNKEAKIEINYLLKKEGKSMTWLSKELGLSSPQALNNKFNNKKLGIEEVTEMLKPIGYEIKFKKVK